MSETGVVTGVSSRMIQIGESRFFLGEFKSAGIDMGDTVSFAADAHDWLTELEVVAKKNGSTTPPAATKKTAAAKKTPAEEPPKTCVLGECPDKNTHFAFNKQRNRWECSLQGIDNPQISHCPLVPRKPNGTKPTTTESTEERAKRAGIGIPPEPFTKRVTGNYISHDKKNIMLRVNGSNSGYSAGPDLIKYLNSKGCQVTPELNVTIELVDDHKGDGFVATLIGPAVTEELKQDPPAAATNPPPAQGPSPAPAAGPLTDQSTTYDHGRFDQAIVLQQNQPQMITPSYSWTDEEIILIRNTIARGCTEPEFKLLMYLARTYGLDPLAKQIWAVKRNENAPALIFAGRDGLLAVAHRSGKFDGMQSGVDYEGEGKDRKPKSAWCEIWRKDMSHSFKTEVPFSEYNTGVSVWKTNPSAMILKVAEAVCLRKAFVISGLYSPEEIDTEGGKGRA